MATGSVRVALIHALSVSVAPINEEMALQWPECQRVNLLDDSLPGDLVQSRQALHDMSWRFLALVDYAVSSGAHGLLFTCSAFGPCIDAVALRHANVPVLKPNEAMIAEAIAARKRVGLVASFAPKGVKLSRSPSSVWHARALVAQRTGSPRTPPTVERGRSTGNAYAPHYRRCCFAELTIRKSSRFRAASETPFLKRETLDAPMKFTHITF